AAADDQYEDHQYAKMHRIDAELDHYRDQYRGKHDKSRRFDHKQPHDQKQNDDDRENDIGVVGKGDHVADDSLRNLFAADDPTERSGDCDDDQDAAGGETDPLKRLPRFTNR